jgi:hypothetical protein
MAFIAAAGMATILAVPAVLGAGIFEVAVNSLALMN